MSTKVSLFYYEKEGKEIHFYFDYADWKVHLVVNGKELEGIEPFLRWVWHLENIYEKLNDLNLLMRLVKKENEVESEEVIEK